MRGCVMHNDLWPWPIPSRSFSHEFAIQLLKYVTSFHVRSLAHTVLDGLFTYFTQMTSNIKSYVTCNDLWSWPISSRVFSHKFAIKLPKYGTSCHVHSKVHRVLDKFLLYMLCICLQKAVYSHSQCRRGGGGVGVRGYPSRSQIYNF